MAGEIIGQTGSTTTSYDPLMYSTLTDLLTAARNEANVPYAAYNGQRIASFTPEEQQAFSAIQGLQGVNQGMYNQGASLLNQGAAGLSGLSSMNTMTPDMLQGYMNPYIQNVVDSTTANALRNAQLERNKLRSQAGLTGAFGGDRMAIAEQELNSNTNRNINDSVSQLLSSGYNTALDQFNKDRQYGLDSLKPYLEYGSAYSNMADQNQAYRLKDAEALNNVGNIKRDMAQSSLDTAYQDWANARDYNKGQINYLSSVLNGTNLNNFASGQSTVTNNQYPKASTFNSILGGLSTGLGFLSNSGFLGSNTKTKARGGLVELEGYAEGGRVTRKRKVEDLSEGFYDNAPSEDTTEADLRQLVKRYGERGFAQGGNTKSRYEQLKDFISGIPEGIRHDFDVTRNDLRVTQGLPNSSLTGPLITGLTKMAQLPGEAYDWAFTPENPINEDVMREYWKGRGTSSNPTPLPEVYAEPVAQTNDTDLASVIGTNPTGLQSVPDVGPQQPDAQAAQQKAEATGQSPATLADLFTYQQSPMDDLFQPNPLIMMGLGLLGSSGNPNDPGYQFATGVGSALEKYEAMKNQRQQRDTERGSAMGSILSNERQSQLDNAYKNRALEETIRNNKALEAINSSKVDAALQAAMLRAQNGGRVKPSDVTAARNAVLNAQRAVLTIGGPGVPGYAAAKLQLEQAQKFLDVLTSQQLDLSSGDTFSGGFTESSIE